jgi:hypothetical protein
VIRAKCRECISVARSGAIRRICSPMLSYFFASGYGIMGAMAAGLQASSPTISVSDHDSRAGELCARWVESGPRLLTDESPLKEYAAFMSPSRYSDYDYVRQGGAMESFMRSCDSL